ncbi:DNA primase [Candidatus Poriferisodalis sp.]|uniref:DNA primase n=1 Tax=Candidatus Poriferisodalis sp. TaxID=3101277 RepID=UPI003B52CCAA
MSIRDSDVQRVREATDLVALIGRRVSLKRVGSRHVGLCPFHSEKTPSFSVSGTDGFYHCFGCKASGDAITFLRETEQLDFTDAVEQLAASANITLTYDAPGAQRANQRRKELLDLLERAACYYHERLMTSADAGEARAYLRRRGYDRDTVVKWRLGYAPPLWDALCRHLDAAAPLLAAAGLAYSESRRASRAADGEDSDGDGDQASDFFRDRVMFPICDASGRVVSFAGRVLPRPDEPPPKGPKYKNTAGTAVYDKSKVLYGLHLAKQAARTTERIVVCEGHTDVIGCDLAGISEAVATCGTALTAQHAELLSRSAKRIVLAFDADAAGQTAAERVHQWERAYGLDAFVAKLPAGADPGDLAASNPPALRAALDKAQPLHTFRAERILERADLDSPAGRDRAADEAAQVFAVYPGEVLLDSDLEPIAGGIPMDVGSFRERVDAARRGLEDRPPSAASDPYADAPPPPDRGEDYHDAYDGGAYDSGYPGEAGVASFAESQPHRRGRGAGAVRAKNPQQRATDDVRLLAAALAPQGNAADLLVRELFATPAGAEAFDRVCAGAHVGDDPGDSAAELLAAGEKQGAMVSTAEAVDRATLALRHFVWATRRSVGGSVHGPHIELDRSNPNTEQLLRWLHDRESELLDASVRVGAAQSVVSWVHSLRSAQPPAGSGLTGSEPADAVAAGEEEAAAVE